MRRRFGMIVVLNMCLALAAYGCGGGDDGDDGDGGEILVGQDCPDECIPRCHFEARSRFAECFPHGETVCSSLGDGAQAFCYGNGMKMKLEYNSNYTIFTYYKEGSICYVQDRVHGGIASELEGETLKGKDEVLLEVIEYEKPTSTDVFTATCGGKVRQVSLIVNATNPACSKCPKNPFAFPENPDPPARQGSCTSGACSIP